MRVEALIHVLANKIERVLGRVGIVIRSHDALVDEGDVTAALDDADPVTAEDDFEVSSRQLDCALSLRITAATNLRSTCSPQPIAKKQRTDSTARGNQEADAGGQQRQQQRRQMLRVSAMRRRQRQERRRSHRTAAGKQVTHRLLTC